jgi:hypothetical protein
VIVADTNLIAALLHADAASTSHTQHPIPLVNSSNQAG